jgi:peptide/nickel transport system permease protein
MTRLLLNRLVRLAATLLAVSFLTFLMVNLLPGDPVNSILPPESQTPERIAQVRADLGLDDPLPKQYVDWLSGVVQFDFGQSYRTNQPVREALLQRLPVTVELAILAIGIAVVFGVPLGVISAYKQGQRLDTVISSIVQFMLSIPAFVAAVFFIYLFAVQFQVLPATGWTRVTNDLWGNLKTAILPAVALSLSQLAIYTRLVRADMITTLQENFVLSARAKGLTNRFILFRHALRPSSLSLITVVGLNIGILLGGTVVIEKIFALPGIGGLLIDSIGQRDYLVVQGVVLLIATSYVVINTVVDLVYAMVDPRIRVSGKGN